MTAQLPVTPTAQIVYRGGTSPVGVTMVNQDDLNAVYVGETQSVSIGGSDADVIPPRGFISYTGEKNRYACAPTGTAPLIVTDAVNFGGPAQSFIALAPFVNFTVQASQTNTYGPFPVSSYGSVFAVVRNVTGAVQCAVRMSADPAAAEIISAPTWRLNSAVNLLSIIPILGPWCTVALRELSGSAPATGELAFAGTTSGADMLTYPNQRPMVSFAGQSVAAGATSLFQLPTVIRGQWYLSVTPADSSGELTFSVVQVNPATLAAAAVIDSINAPTAQARLIGAAPDDTNPLALQVANADLGGPHSFSGSLIVI